MRCSWNAPSPSSLPTSSVTDSRRSPALTATSGMALAEVGWGAALLLFAAPLLQSFEGEPLDRRVIIVARVLGGRQFLQGLLILRRPTRRILRIAGVVDALHAATMVAAMAVNAGPRRLTTASATLAAAFSAGGISQSRGR
jgi:hypothetical protein